MLDRMTMVQSAVLVGRETDLAVLHDALKLVHGDEPVTLLVGGEAGVGKSRLVEEFYRATTARVLVGQCLELGEEGLPFAPFAAALRELCRREGRGALGGREAEFARLLPELGPLPESAETHRGHLFELVASLFTRLGQERPLILVVEDLHWADRSTRDLIAFLVRSARVPRLLLIATYRTDELHRGHPLRPFLAELERVRGVRRLDVDRLDRDGTAELLGHLLGAEPDPPTTDALFGRTQGIPFFVEQFASTADPRCADIPETLRDLLLSRVDQLPDQAQRVLRVAAVGGTRFGHELLARVAEIDDAPLESALRATVTAQLINFDPAGGYEFRHALVREAVHDDLLPGEHARLHARFARVIEAEPHLVDAERAPAEIAHHWFAAHDRPRALVTTKAAADAAGGRFAFAERARLLDRVLDLWEQVPDPAGLLGTSHLDLLEETALTAIRSGDHQRAISLTRAALADLDHETEPLRAARLLIRRANLLRNAGKSDGVTEAREAYRLLGLAPRDRDWLKLLSSVASVYTGIDTTEAARIAQEVMSAAIELGDEGSRAAAEITFGTVCGGHVDARESIPILRRTTDRARAGDDVSNLANGLVYLSDQLFEVGEYQESADAAASGVPLAGRIGISRTTGAYLLTNHAEALLALGRWDDAEACLAEATREDPPGTLAIPGLWLRASLRLARGHDGAAALISRAVGFLGKPYLDIDHRLKLVELRLRAALAGGDQEIAREIARTALASDLLTHLPRYSWAVLAAAARALPPQPSHRPPPAVRTPVDPPPAVPTPVHQPFEAQASVHPPPAAHTSLHPLSRRSRDPGPSEAERFPAAEVRPSEADFEAPPDLAELIRAAADRLPQRFPAERAYAAQVAADLDGGSGRWETAVGAWRADGQPYPLAFALLRCAETIAADRPAALAMITEARAIAAGLGAKPLIEAADTLARRLGARSTTTPVAGTEVLTAREREVLHLVAEGQSNSQIARTLFISAKTASVHVSRIIAKLQVTNRIEAAAVAHRLGLLKN
ncbi:MAG TPA: AAA family ATPase [Actinoplanes sp.]|nr:AAA family ATPase [Actinoplanes sp.]